MNTNIKGTITELKCQTYFLELGYNVSIPLSPDRYDFILDFNNELLKIQVKTSSTRKDGEAFYFQTSSSHFVKGQHTHSTYKEDNIDYFATCWENQVYLIPVEECGAREKNLRIMPTRNGQVKGICFAKDYIAEEVLKRR